MNARPAPCLLAPLLLVVAAWSQPAQEDLTVQLEALRAEAAAPALGAALVTADGLDGVWAVGQRSAKDDAAVTVDDQWHLGSCTKAMTATLIALLCERGDLAWDTRLPSWFTDLPEEMDPAFRNVTLVELLGHRAGLDDRTSWPTVLAMRNSTMTRVVQRQLIAEAVLCAPPAHAPGGTYQYSNTGYILAGHVAEIVTGKPWEELMTELLFTPLGMHSAGFGPPGTRGIYDQPRGHWSGGKSMEPSPLADNPAALGPAGTVHASLADWARFVQLHLRGHLGDVQVGEITLHAATFARLHTPLSGPGEAYAMGWVQMRRPWAGGDGTTLWHNGSNNMWYCATWLGLERGVAVLVTANERSPAIEKATDKAADLLLGDWVLRQVDEADAAAGR